MANENVQTIGTSATPKLAEELSELESRVRRMETLLMGAESILSTIRYDSGVEYTPANPSAAAAHRRSLDMVEFLGAELTRWRADVFEMDFAADDIQTLVTQAENLKLVRYGKCIPE